ncbi:MAG: hypothetical protein M1818_000473 [Claussenomyces sp. TS43310]|nr:MAG: hypothetical protein M1818_000473 [Claussenomyces sp. TS43310]
MQRVTSILPSWEKTKTGGKKGFDKVWEWSDKLGAPVNRLSNRIGSEAFWPTTLDKESDKAARILRSFCKDGFYTQEDRPTNQDGPSANTKQRVLKKIPPKVIENAVGLAIFTVMRTGLWISGAGGSGVLIARMDNGEWSPPSGILLHTAGLGFIVGVDIYDCVVVINNRKALEAFKRLRATLGGEVSVVAGPVGVGGVLENDGKWKQANRPVFTYLKSRGFYAGVQVDGTIVIERTDENEKFYGERIGVGDILAGKARHPPHGIKMLMETVKAAEGRSDVDQEMMEVLEDQPAPGDVEVEASNGENGTVFGIPEPDDPDPFGVLALEKAGLEIREAGSRSRPPSSQFEYRPSPTSPIYGQFHRRSMDTLANGSNRGSFVSFKRASIDRAVQTSEMATQTSEDDLATLPISPIRRESRPVVKEEELPEPEEVDYTKIDLGPYSPSKHSDSAEFNGSGTTTTSRSHEFDSDPAHHHDTSDHSDSENDDDEEPVVFEAAAAQTATLTPQINLVQARGSLVEIPKRIPPPLPPRSLMRSGRSNRPTVDGETHMSPLASPTGDGFEEVGLEGGSRRSTSSPLSDRAQSPFGLGIVMQDVEEETAAEPDAAHEPLDSKWEADVTAVKDREREPERHSTSLSASKEDEDAEDFHSLPPTPNEVEKHA